MERVRAAGAVLIGPNCLGIHDSGAQLELCSEDLESGSIGLISQSGNLALEIGMVGAEFGLGFSRFVSLGNQADVQAAELIESFAEHESTQLIAIYLEDFRDGREFARAGEAAVERGRRSCAPRRRGDRGERAGREVAHRRAGQRPGLDPGRLPGCRDRARRLAEGGRGRRHGTALAPSAEGAPHRPGGGRGRPHGRGLRSRHRRGPRSSPSSRMRLALSSPRRSRRRRRSSTRSTSREVASRTSGASSA